MPTNTEASDRQRIANLLGEVDRLRVASADWKHLAEERQRIIRLKSLMENDLIDALEPLWQRARAPGADQVPDDAPVTVFMRDCREAFRVISGRSPTEFEARLAASSLDEPNE